MKLPATLLKSLALTVGSLGVAGCNVNLSNPETEPSTNTPAPTNKPASAPEQAAPPRAGEGQGDGCRPAEVPDVFLVPNPNKKPAEYRCFYCGLG